MSTLENSTGRRMLSVNLQTLAMLIFVTPLNILNVYVYITDDSCEKSPDLAFYGKICTTIAGISGVFYLYIAWIKLEKVT